MSALWATIGQIARDIRKFSHARHLCEDPVVEHFWPKWDTFAKNKLKDVISSTGLGEGVWDRTILPRGGLNL